ncbi:MAG: tetratricopeptide repeat protein [Acidobacteriota bacterium]
MRLNRALIAASLATLVGAGCRTSSRVSPVPDPPGLDTLQPGPRDQYRERRSRLDQLVAEHAGGEKLGDAYGALGMWHQVYDFPDAATICYRNAETLDPSNPRWPYFQGHVLRGKDLATARACFIRVLKLRPGDVPTRTWLAEIALAEGRTVEARAAFERIVTESPRNVRALLGLGKMALAEGHAAEAISYLSVAAVAQPSGTEIHYALGMAYRALGDRDRAEQELAKGQVDNVDRVEIASSDPFMEELDAVRQDATRYSTQGRDALARGDFAVAIDLFRRAVSISGGTAEDRLNLGLALMQAGRTSEAIAQFEDALRADPRSATAHFAIAIATAADPATSEEHYRSALALNPKYLEAHYNLANLLRHQARFDEALSHYSEVLAIEPGHANAEYFRAESLIHLGHFTEVRDLLEHAVAAGGGPPQLLSLLSRVYATSPVAEDRDPQRAVELAMRGYDASPTLNEAETVAMALAASGDFARAIAWQEACVAVVGDGERAAWVQDRLANYRSHRAAPAPFAVAEEPLLVTVPPPARG